MAFLATPAYSTLYPGNLLTIASNAAQITPSDERPSEVAVEGDIDVTGVAPDSIAPSPANLNHFDYTCNQSSFSVDECRDAKQRKLLDPFDPDASVPLPHQLEDHPFTTSVWKRNERERFRVRCVNDGYERLRQHLPLAEGDKRMSKVDTLRLAIRYISHLDATLKKPNHLLDCRCFDRFREESEGNVAVAIRDNGERIQHHY